MAVKTHKATLGGVTLDAFGPIEWKIVGGAKPYETAVECESGTAENLATRAGHPLTLTLRDEGGETLTIEKVYLLAVRAGSAPHSAVLHLSDRRWLWQRRHVKRTFNWRRRTGDRVLVQDAGIPREIPFVADDYYYAQWSLNSERSPWTATEVLREVVRAADEQEPRVQSLVGAEHPIENLDIDAPGNVAVATALSMVAGANVYIGHDGVPVVYDEGNLSIVDRVLDRTGPAIVGAGYPMRTSLAAERPSTVRVLFTVEQEVRFDSVTEAGGRPGETVTVETNRRGDEQREMENVLPLPDVTTSIGGKGIPRGTYVPVTQAVSAWSASVLDGQSVSLPLIRELWLSNLDAYMTGLGLSTPNGVAVSRLGALRTHFRQTYRLNPRWIARMRHLQDQRVAIIHPVTGTRAPAVAYTDYAIHPSYKGRRWDEDLGRHYLMNVEGWSERLVDSQMAPAVVRVLDPDQGIVRIEYHTEPLGMWQAVIPSLVENVPQFKPGEGVPIVLDAAGDQSGAPRLSSGHRAAVVLSAIPAAPNSNGVLYAVEIDGSEAAELAGIGGQPCNGPVWEVRVNPGLATARFSWSDDHADRIEQRFGVGKDFQAPETQNIPALDELLVNPNETRAIARASAAVVVAALADRHTGAKTVRLDPSVFPSGMLDSIAHRLGVAGELTTSLTFTPDAPVPSLLSLLDAGTRQNLLRFIPQRNG